MIKKLSYFPSQSALNSAPILSAMITSARSQGIDCVADDLNADAAIIWSVLWSGRMSKNQQVYEHYVRNNRPVVVVDVGYFDRGRTWRIGIGNINACGWFGNDRDLDMDRPKKLEISLGKSTSGSSILIASQHAGSLQWHGQGDMTHWILEQIKKIQTHSDRPIVVRPHPRSPINVSLLPKNITVMSPQRLANTYDSFDWTNNWHAVINHNSGPGILAAIAGVRPIVHESSLANPVSISIEQIEAPYNTDRESWLIGLSHCEYLLEEIAQGLWLKRLHSKLN